MLILFLTSTGLGSLIFGWQVRNFGKKGNACAFPFLLLSRLFLRSKYAKYVFPPRAFFVKSANFFFPLDKTGAGDYSSIIKSHSSQIP